MSPAAVRRTCSEMGGVAPSVGPIDEWQAAQRFPANRLVSGSAFAVIFNLGMLRLAISRRVCTSERYPHRRGTPSGCHRPDSGAAAANLLAPCVDKQRMSI